MQYLIENDEIFLLLSATKIRFGFVQIRKTNAKLRGFIDLMNLLWYNIIVFLYLFKVSNFGGVKMKMTEAEKVAKLQKELGDIC